jgi:hypothetical protein
VITPKRWARSLAISATSGLHSPKPDSVYLYPQADLNTETRAEFRRILRLFPDLVVRDQPLLPRV